MIGTNALKLSIERLIGGIGTTNDRRILQDAYLNGRIVHVDGERNVTAGGDVTGNVIISGDVTVNIEFSYDDLTKLRDLVFPNPSGIFPPFPHLIFIGRNEAVTDIKSRLGLGAGGRSSAPVIVRGWPGVGKTTLVSVLSRDADIVAKYPDGILWTSLEQNPNLASILAGWGRALGREDLLRVPTAEEIVLKLAAVLQSRQMLLIVDDIWKAEDGVLFQKAQGANCGLLMTTRLERVAEELSQADDEIYVLPVLKEEDALRLVSILAPEVVKQYPEQCLELINNLEKLPLAIHVAAKLLRREYKKGWGIEGLIEEINDGAKILEAKAPPDRAEKGQIPTVQALLKKSTDLLSDRIREYFAYLGAFAPKPATFSEDHMRFVWKVSDARPIIRELYENGLLEPVGNGRFQMHALLVAHARSLCP
jgi:hypothetical protein